MRINRFFGDFDFSKKVIKISDRDIYNQIKNVLRMEIGERIILCDGKLNEALSEIVNLGRSFIELKILDINKNENEFGVYGILYCSMLKKENFELVIQKATEIGIKEIVPIITKRTVKLNLNEKRLNKIIKEAAEQSGRGILPILNKPMHFQDALNKAGGDDLNLFFDPSGKSFAQMSNVKCQLSNVGIWIGPEGGWDEEEIKMAKDKGFKIVSLGKLTFRAETAAIVGSFLAAVF